MTLQDLLGIELPIIQAPMAGVQAGAMTIAVSNAGGLGSLPSALLSPSALKDELRLITAQTSKPYNVNFFCHSLPARDQRKERAWRDLLAPYFEELGVDPASIADGPVRAPFSSEVADVVDEFRPPVVKGFALRWRWELPEHRSVLPTSYVRRRLRARFIARR